MPASLDLTGVGFTPTEGAAYAALLELGPASGYAVAKSLSIARANAYQALHGLVGKGAALLTGESPQQFRALAPAVLLTKIADQQARKLDQAERALRSLDGGGAPGLHRFSGERAFQEVALRTAARASGTVRCVAPPPVLAALIPLWRKRASDGAATQLWSLVEAPAGFPIDIAGVVPEQRLGGRFREAPVLLDAEDAVIAALAGPDFAGFWTTEPALTAPIRVSLDSLTST